MAINGWYPDPGGAPGRFRYWDGQTWSTETTDDPRTTPPSAVPPSEHTPTGSAASPAPSHGSTRRPGLIVVAAVVVLVVILAGVFVVRGLTRPDTTVAGSDPDSTASGWDDSSPLPTATPTPSRSQTPRATPPPSTSAAQPPQQVACPRLDPSAHPPRSADDRVHGGDLSFPRVASYPAPATDYQFSWWTDVMSQTQVTEPTWISIFAVGQVSTADDGFGTAREAAESSMECAITEGWYQEFTGRKDLKNAKFTVDGRAGWIIRSEIRVDRSDLTVDGDQLTFVAIDDGRPGVLSMWCGMVPLGDTARIAIDADVLRQLKVD